MATETLQQLPAAITGNFNIALTQSKFQALQSKADTLVYNEDNLEEIAQFLKDMRKVDSAIDDTHTEGKAAAWKVCCEWDLGKRTFKGITAAIIAKPQSEYTKLCKQIEERKRKAAEEELRIKNIQQGIETNALKFATDIANATSSEDLTNIERIINLEKSRKEKYQEFLEDAVTRYNELNSLLKTQKITVKEHENILLQKQEAEKEGDDEKLLELHQKQEAVEIKIDEAKINIQETAIAQSTNTQPEYAHVMFPTVKARRTTWAYEIVDVKEVMKKAPELLIVSLDTNKAKEVLKTLKDTKQLDGKKELILNGIKYFEQVTF